MNRLLNIEDFESFIGYPINESLTDGSQSVCNKAFINSGVIEFSDGSTVHPKEIVGVVNAAINYLSDEFTRTFRFATRINIIFLRDSRKIKTMAVDENMNLYMNAGFIYHTLKMDKYLVGAVIMHEVFHVLFNHIERGKNWLASKGRGDSPEARHDNNLAADIEVNQTLVRLEITDEDTITNVIQGLYLKNAGGELGKNTNVVPMEIILDDDECMKKLRSMCPNEVNPEQGKEEKTIKTTDEWDKGYKEAWNKLARLIKKYGYKEAWNKLLEAGVVNGAGEMYKDSVDKIKLLEGLNIHIFNHINEDAGMSAQKGQTYDDGYMTATNKIINALYDAVFGASDNKKSDKSNTKKDKGYHKAGGEKYETGVNENELDDISLPKNIGGGGESDDDGLPNKIQSGSDSQSDSDGNSKSNSKGAGKGGQGKNDDDITDDDMNKLVDDLKNKYSSGSEKDGQSQKNDSQSGENQEQSNTGDSNEKDGKSSQQDGDPGSIGGTGSFVDSGEMNDDILKDAGYSQDDIDAINEIRKKNKERNTRKGIEKARQELRNTLSSGSFLKKYLDAVEVESAKYINVWKEIMEEFLAQKTRRAGTKTYDKSINWKRKTRIALGNVGPQYRMVDQDPQDVNIYVDVSGSMDLELLEIIAKSIIIFTQEYQYSGINICPWASVSNGIYRVDDFAERDADSITEEVLKIISKGAAQCGGGTSEHAVISAMIDVVAESLNSEDKEQKDDVHIVITDGQFNINNIETKMYHAIRKETERDDVAELAPEHTFWMIYDANQSLQNEWKNSIKKGKIIFINSESVKNNK